MRHGSRRVIFRSYDFTQLQNPLPISSLRCNWTSQLRRKIGLNERNDLQAKANLATTTTTNRPEVGSFHAAAAAA